MNGGNFHSTKKGSCPCACSAARRGISGEQDELPGIAMWRNLVLRMGILIEAIGPGVCQGGRGENSDSAFLQPRKLYQLTLPYPRAHPLNLLNPLNRLYNFRNGGKKGKCRYFLLGKVATPPITPTPLTPTHSIMQSHSTK